LTPAPKAQNLRAMVQTPPQQTPEQARVSTFRHRVPFYQTDAMGIVHHANYAHLLEIARVRWLEEHDQPYRDYVADELHFAVTRMDVRYRRAARFDEELDVSVWVQWVRGASLGIAYEIRCGDDQVATAITEHAMVDGDGRPCRIPRAQRESLARAATG